MCLQHVSAVCVVDANFCLDGQPDLNSQQAFEQELKTIMDASQEIHQEPLRTMLDAIKKRSSKRKSRSGNAIYISAEALSRK